MAGNANSGRKPKSYHYAAVQQTINSASGECATILAEYAKGKREITSGQLDAIKYIINQFMGMPKQRQDIDISAESGSGVTFMFINPKPVEIEPVEVKELPVPADVIELEDGNTP
jgi:hypothetical protein